MSAHFAPRQGIAAIELTEQQIELISSPRTGPPCAVNPRTREKFVLVSVEEYRRLTGADYDDSGWTRDELHAQAWEAGRSLGWEEMIGYDDPSDNPTVTP